MKPETKRSASNDDDDDGDSSTFNLSSMKHAIESIDPSKERAFNLSSLAVALSAASRNIKKPERCDHYDKRKKKKKKNEPRVSKFARIILKKKPMMIGTKPDTEAELQRWFSHFDELFTQSLFETKKKTMPYQVPTKPKTPITKDDQQIEFCTLNTECSHAFF